MKDVKIMFQIKDGWVHINVEEHNTETKKIILSPEEVDFINQSFIYDIIIKSKVLVKKNYEF